MDERNVRRTEKYEGKTLQAVFSAALAALSAYFGTLVIPLIMLTAAMIIDYGTGMAAAWKRSELSSKKGVSGIIKKVGYLVLVCVGMLVDWLIFCGLENFDAGSSYKFSFGMLVAIWFIINKLISIVVCRRYSSGRCGEQRNRLGVSAHF